MNQIYTQIIKESIRKKIFDSEKFLFFKKKIFSKYFLPQPTNADLREHYEKLIALKKIKRCFALEKALLSRKIRTRSGVAVVAVLTKEYPCPGKCVYCPTEKNMPKSYLSNEPAVMRAIASRFNPYRQVRSRLRSLELNGHITDKIELIVMGGTFSCLPKTYQMNFIAECFRACNEYPKDKTRDIKRVTIISLLKEQKKNERAKHRIVGLTLETRPDYINEKEILNFRKLGCTRIELGVQSIFDNVLKKNKRGHLVAETIRATKLLKDAGFKINYHIMPGLPGSDILKDYKMFQELFSNPDFQPDMLKIYPTVVIKTSELYNLWKKGCYKPLTDQEFEKLILRVKNKIIPPYVRIARLVRDVPKTSIVAGPKCSNLRQIIAPQSKCPCIRCREVKLDYKINEKIILSRIDYAASGGKEIFLQYISPDEKKLFALLRLRIPHFIKKAEKEKNLYTYFPAIENAALIREIHTYGKLTSINKKDKNSPQHIGLGRKLMLKAELIAKKEFGLNKIAVISGIGVKGYYRKLGYKQKDTYMLKEI